MLAQAILRSNTDYEDHVLKEATHWTHENQNVTVYEFPLQQHMPGPPKQDQTWYTLASWNRPQWGHRDFCFRKVLPADIEVPSIPPNGDTFSF